MIRWQKNILIFIVVGFLTDAGLSAYDGSPRCFRELQRNFFQPSTVSLALSFYRNIPQPQWLIISRALQARNGTIPQLMRDQARRLRPNPLEDPFDPVGAEDLFRQVLWTIFADVMIQNGVSRPSQIEGAFNSIWRKESGRIADCLGLPPR
ncbi:MAG: hypothetical protein WB791_06750 [Waddliaceae bacterium]